MMEKKSEELNYKYCVNIYFFGVFRILINGDLIKDWQNGKSKTIFKYPVAHRQRPISKEFLMELLWPGSEIECARNNLNVSIYNIRQSIKHGGKKIPCIDHMNGQYSINPNLKIWTDFEEFIDIFDEAEKHRNNNDLEREISTLELLDKLYVDDFLAEDQYEDWIIPLIPISF